MTPGTGLRWSQWQQHHKHRAVHATTCGKPPENHQGHNLRLEY